MQVHYACCLPIHHCSHRILVCTPVSSSLGLGSTKLLKKTGETLPDRALKVPQLLGPAPRATSWSRIPGRLRPRPGGAHPAQPPRPSPPGPPPCPPPAAKRRAPSASPPRPSGRGRSATSPRACGTTPSTSRTAAQDVQRSEGSGCGCCSHARHEVGTMASETGTEWGGQGLCTLACPVVCPPTACPHPWPVPAPPWPAHVVIYFVSSEVMKCRLLKLLLDHPMKYTTIHFRLLA